MTRPLTAQQVATAFHDACLAELDALKPGNVHRHGDDPRMTVEDFERSARAAAAPLAQGDTVGERIVASVAATMQAVGKNTNLGIILLAAPLASAAMSEAPGDLRARLAESLAGLSVEDARDAYAAIRQANPGGLSEVPRHGVGGEPAITLLEAMRVAEGYDRIAWNYSHEFGDIFDLGLPRLEDAAKRGWPASLPVRVSACLATVSASVALPSGAGVASVALRSACDRADFGRAPPSSRPAAPRANAPPFANRSPFGSFSVSRRRSAAPAFAFSFSFGWADLALCRVSEAVGLPPEPPQPCTAAGTSPPAVAPFQPSKVTLNAGGSPLQRSRVATTSLFASKSSLKFESGMSGMSSNVLPGLPPPISNEPKSWMWSGPRRSRPILGTTDPAAGSTIATGPSSGSFSTGESANAEPAIVAGGQLPAGIPGRSR